MLNHNFQIISAQNWLKKRKISQTMYMPTHQDVKWKKSFYRLLYSQLLWIFLLIPVENVIAEKLMLTWPICGDWTCPGCWYKIVCPSGVCMIWASWPWAINCCMFCGVMIWGWATIPPPGCWMMICKQESNIQ